MRHELKMNGTFNERYNDDKTVWDSNDSFFPSNIPHDCKLGGKFG